MKRARILSYGVIPIYESANGPRVLLVEQYGAQGTHWGFPKGRGNPGELPIETAKRELREETSVVATKLIDEAPFTVNYSFTYEDTIVDKTVTYFIGLVMQPGVAFQESEIKNGGWYTFDEARRKLSFINTKDMFESALRYLDEHQNHE